MQPSQFRSLPALTLLVLTLTGCSSVYVPSFIKVYQPDIAQGNIIEPKQVAQIKVGMDKSEVNQILGSPALKDIFHHNQRETYVFYDKRGKNTAFKHILVVVYDANGRVTKIEQSGDPLDQTPPQDLPEALRPENDTDHPEEKAKEMPSAEGSNPASDPYALTPPGGGETGLGSGQPLQPGGGL
jgi:outer membrane protein assembly factor BamE